MNTEKFCKNVNKKSRCMCGIEFRPCCSCKKGANFPPLAETFCFGEKFLSLWDEIDGLTMTPEQNRKMLMLAQQWEELRKQTGWFEEGVKEK